MSNSEEMDIGSEEHKWHLPLAAQGCSHNTQRHHPYYYPCQTIAEAVFVFSRGIIKFSKGIKKKHHGIHLVIFGGQGYVWDSNLNQKILVC